MMFVTYPQSQSQSLSCLKTNLTFLACISIYLIINKLYILLKRITS